MWAVCLSSWKGNWGYNQVDNSTIHKAVEYLLFIMFLENLNRTLKAVSNLLKLTMESSKTILNVKFSKYQMDTIRMCSSCLSDVSIGFNLKSTILLQTYDSAIIVAWLDEILICGWFQVTEFVTIKLLTAKMTKMQKSSISEGLISWC